MKELKQKIFRGGLCPRSQSFNRDSQSRIRAIKVEPGTMLADQHTLEAKNF